MQLTHTKRARRAAAALLAGVLLTALAGCTSAGGATGTAGAGAASSAREAQQPVATTAADWKGVSEALGRTGKLIDNATVYRVALPRADLHVTTEGVTVKPGLALGGWAAFARYSDGTMVMGDLVVTEPELPKVTDALQAHGIQQTAVHKHLLTQTPAVWWTHIHAMGDPLQLAQGVKAALDATAIPPAAPAATHQPPLDLDTAGIDAALGRKGTADAGVYKFTIGRKDTVQADGHILPSGLGITTVINFQPLGGGRAAINGDFVMTADEVQKVIQALRRGGIQLVELHNHSLDEQPRLFYAHFWAVGDGVTLAKALRPALDATNPQPAH